MGFGVSAEMETLLLGFQNPHLKEIDLSLGRMERLLAALGNPHHRLPPVIHVAGTNGKGSLIAYLRAMFEAAGKQAHVYTSPHLVRFHERIVLAGREVADAPLLEALRKVDALKKEFPATFFEATTAAAFLLFAQEPADVLLLEVGMGGRLDATNVIRPKDVLLTAITPVSKDHMEFLGETLVKIAQEKAGILKPNVPCVVGPQEPDALKAIETQAGKTGVPLFDFGREWYLQQLESGMEYRGRHFSFTLPTPSLAGMHQWANAATAVACMDMLHEKGMSVPLPAIANGIQHAHWPGRLQPFQVPFLLKHLPEGSRIWLDGGHNPAAGRAIAEWASGLDKKPFLVCGMRSTKDAKSFLEALRSAVQGMVAIPIPGEVDFVEPAMLKRLGESYGIQSRVADGVADSMRKITQFELEDSAKNIIISGSLYLVGHFLKQGLHSDVDNSILRNFPYIGERL